MAVNKRKILEVARKLAQKGAKEKALKEYQKLLKLDPKDAKLKLEIGDAHRRWGKVDEAVETYRRVAEQYSTEGFDARAVAVYKQILNLDPDRFEAYAPLSELYERMGLTAEAIGSLQTAADGFHRQGRKKEALEILRKMANADPSNTTSRIKVADLLRQEGQIEEAQSEYELAAEELERQGDAEAVGNVYRRMLEIDGKHVGALSALAGNFAKRGKVAEAVPLAERALELDDGRTEHYETLASLYERTHRNEQAIGVYRLLAEHLRRRGDEDAARNILQRHVPTRELAAPGGAEPAAAPPDELSGAGLLDGGEDSLFGDEFPDSEGAPEIPLDFGAEIDIGGTTRESLPGLGDSQSGPLVEATDPDLASTDDAPSGAGHAVAGDADVEQLLAEASVYLRYGKRDKAIEHLEHILDSDPEHRAALEKLGEAFAESGRSERAVELWLRAAKRAAGEGDEDALRVLRGRIASLDEGAAASLDASAGAPAGDLAGDPDPDDLELELGGGAALDFDDELLDDDELDAIAPPPRAAAAAGAPPLAAQLPDRADDEEFELDLGDLAEPGSELESEPGEPRPGAVAVPRSAPGNTTGSGLSAETRAKVLEDLEEADFYLQQGLDDDAEQIYRRVLSLAPNHPRAMLRLGELAAARGEVPSALAPAAAESAPDRESDRFELDDPGEVEIAIDAAVGEIEDPEPALSTGEDLEGLSDLDLPAQGERSSALEETQDDTDDETQADGSDTEEFEPNLDSPDAPRTAAPTAAAVEASGGFDLAAALADAFDDAPAERAPAPVEDDGFAAVFAAFKQGVRETLGEGDHQAHYDLAIAYKEMGLLDDAIRELRVAMGDPGRTAECLHLIGMCAIDADQALLAIEHLEQLLALPAQSPGAVLAARFDLGRALAALGDADGARREWQQVVAANPGFQDVRRRLAALDDPEPEAPADGFESLDDVMDAVADDDEPPPVPGENFDDLVAEANAEADGAAEADLVAEPELDLDAEPEPDRAPERESGGSPSGPPSLPRKRKKISFF